MRQMNKSQGFCWIRYSGTMFSSRASETSTKSPMVPRSFSRAVSHLVTRWWAGGTGKKSEMDPLPANRPQISPMKLGRVPELSRCSYRDGSPTNRGSGKWYSCLPQGLP